MGCVFIAARIRERDNPKSNTRSLHARVKYVKSPWKGVAWNTFGDRKPNEAVGLAEAIERWVNRRSPSVVENREEIKPKRIQNG